MTGAGDSIIWGLPDPNEVAVELTLTARAARNLEATVARGPRSIRDELTWEQIEEAAVDDPEFRHEVSIERRIEHLLTGWKPSTWSERIAQLYGPERFPHEPEDVHRAAVVLAGATWCDVSWLMSGMGDVQRHRVYDAEFAVFPLDEEPRLGWQECISLIHDAYDRVSADFPLPGGPPELVSTELGHSEAFIDEGRIAVGAGKARNAKTLLHELCHLLTNVHFDTYALSSHGPEFTAVLMGVFADWFPPERVEALRSSYRTREVQVGTPERVVLPLTDNEADYLRQVVPFFIGMDEAGVAAPCVGRAEALSGVLDALN